MAWRSTAALSRFSRRMPLAVQLHHVEVGAVDAHQHVARTGHQYRRVGLELFVACILLEGIDDLVCMAVEHEYAVVVHAQPDVLRLVDGHVEDAVVQIFDAARVSGLVVVEVEAVEARQSVPGSNPDVAVVILENLGDRIAAESVFGREMFVRCLQLLGFCRLTACQEGCAEYNLLEDSSVVHLVSNLLFDCKNN